MLRNHIVIHQHIALLPLVQHPDVVGDVGQLGKVVLWDGRAVAEELLRDVFARGCSWGERGREGGSVVCCQAGEEGGQVGVGVCADGGEVVGEDEGLVVVLPFPGCVLAAVVALDLRLDFLLPGRCVVAVVDVFAEGLFER